MSTPHKILLIHGSPEIAELVRNSFAEQNLFEFTLELAGSLKEGMVKLDKGSFDTILLDMGLPDDQGIQIFNKVVPFRMNTAIIALTSTENLEEGMRLMKMGAHSFVPKDALDGRCLVRSILFSQEIIRLNSVTYLYQERNIKVFDECPLGIAYVNRMFRFTDVNPVFCSIMGYEKEELLKLTFREITHKEHLAGDVESVEKLINKEIPVYRTEKRYLRKDGKIIWGRVHVSIITDTFGEFIQILAMVEDITERKEAEANLLKSQEKFRHLFESSSVGISLTGLDGTLHINEAFGLITGYSEDELANIKWSEITHPEDIEESNEMIRCLLEGKYSHHRLRKRYIHKNGSIVWADVSTSLQRDENNEPGFFITIIKDITAEKASEERLKEHDAGMRSVLESAGVGILVVNDEGRVTHANTLFRKMWGIPEELMEKGFDDELVHFVLEQVIEPEKFITRVKELYRSSKIDADELKLVDGRIFERLSYPLLRGEKITGRVWSFRDVTRLKIAEAELMKVNEELTDLNATKDKFFSIIAHDLRSPFTSLLGLSKILADQEENLSMDDTRKFAARIHSTLTNQFELLQNLLEWARLQLGKVEFNPVRVNVHQVVSNIVGLLSGNLLKKNIFLENNLDEQIVITIDPNSLISILHNIISNAIKFTRTGGRIWVYSHKSNGHLDLVIRDNGVGISGDRLDQIFRLDSVSSTRGTEGEKGTGLGLILCRELIEKQGGTLRVTSDEHTGTTVIISLPYG